MIWIFTLETITDTIYEPKSRLTCITGSIFFVVRDDPLKSVNEYPVSCAVVLLPCLGEYGICKQEPKFFTQDLKQIGSIPDTIEKPILLFGSGDVLKYGDLESICQYLLDWTMILNPAS